MSQSESKTQIQYDTLIHELDEWIRQGHSNRVLQRLKKLPLTQIPRAYRFPLADLARRISMPLLALKLMNPVMRSADTSMAPPTESEKINYATALTSMGCHQEALEILSKISVVQYPQVDLFASFALFGMWEYEKALPKLRRYVAQKGISDYQRLIGRVNLVAALIDVGLWPTVDQEIAEILKIAEASNASLLLGNIYELQSQSFMARGRYQEALIALDRAENLLKPVGGIYYLFVRKWQTIIHLLLNPKNQAVLERLNLLKSEAIAMKTPEVIRDLDLYLALASSDVERYREVLLATPAPSYKRRAERILGQRIDLPNSHLRGIFPTAQIFHREKLTKEEPAMVLINYSAWSTDQLKKLKFKPTLIKAMEILTRDGYKPVGLGEFYSHLYPNTYFAPLISEKRVHNVLFRLRQLFKALNWPLQILAENQEFRLIPLHSNVRIYKARKNFQIQNNVLDELHRRLQHRSFTASDAAKILGVSRRYIHERIRLGLMQKKLSRFGIGRATRYRFSNHKNLESA